MRFELSNIKDRSSAQVVAILMSGRGDGASTVEAPTVLRVGRSGQNLGYSERVGSGFYEPRPNWRNVGPLRVTYRDEDAPDHVAGTGHVQGILVLGVVARGEAPEAALARLSPGAPDVRELWSTHCEGRMRHEAEVARSLEDVGGGALRR